MPARSAIALMTKTLSEDWLAVWLGIGLFALSFALLAGVDLLGWAVTTSVWMTPAACGALVPLRMVHWRTSSGPVVKKLPN